MNELIESNGEEISWQYCAKVLIFVFMFCVAGTIASIANSNNNESNATATWSNKYIGAATSSKILVGDPDGKLRIKDAATREELAVVVSRLDNKIAYHKDIDKVVDYNFAMICAIFGLLLGVAITVMILGDKHKIIVNVPEIKMPEINPTINVSGIGVEHGYTPKDNRMIKYGVNDMFEEEKYRPTAGTFKEIMNKYGNTEIQINADADRGSVSKTEMDADLKKLMDFKSDK
jgi:hypothetical protein